MYLEKSTKFYELFKSSTNVYIHYGKISGNDVQLPYGTFLLYKFSNINDTKDFYINVLHVVTSLIKAI